MNIFRLLKKNRLFVDFEDKEIDAMFNCLKGRIVNYQVREKAPCIIAKQGDPIVEIGILLDGFLAKLEDKLGGGKRLVGTLNQGEMFGAVEGYVGDKTLPYTVVATEPSQVLYISIPTIVRQCEKTCSYHQKLIENMISYLAECVDAGERDKGYLTIKSMRLKIAKLIYEAYLTQGTSEVRLGMNRNEMAAYLNVSRPSMSREMMRMRDEGMFDFWKDKISIKDVAALEAVIMAH